MSGRSHARAVARIVSWAGAATWLTVVPPAAMTFLTIVALALSQASDRLAARWSDDLVRSATVRLNVPAERLAEQTAAVLRVLAQTPGVATARALSRQEQVALITPWFADGLPSTRVPLPQLIEVVQTASGLDAEGLRLRLAAEVPDAVLEDHDDWRRSVLQAAGGLRLMGALGIWLCAGVMAAVVALAVHAAVSANRQVFVVLRLIGAPDRFILGIFQRRFAVRAVLGTVCGAALALGCLALVSPAPAPGGLLAGLTPDPRSWVAYALIPGATALVAAVATRYAAWRILRRLA